MKMATIHFFEKNIEYSRNNELKIDKLGLDASLHL